MMCLHVLGGGGTGDNFDQLAGNDGLAGTVEENLVLADHLAGVLGSVLREITGQDGLSGGGGEKWGKPSKLTSMALRRAEISQAWPSHRAQ